MYLTLKNIESFGLEHESYHAKEVSPQAHHFFCCYTQNKIIPIFYFTFHEHKLYCTICIVPHYKSQVGK